eukprot:9793263-Alexandrium_andersonii.AAC.1
MIPLKRERQPHDTRATVRSGPLPMLSDRLTRIDDFGDPAAPSWPGTRELAPSGMGTRRRRARGPPSSRAARIPRPRTRTLLIAI